MLVSKRGVATVGTGYLTPPGPPGVPIEKLDTRSRMIGIVLTFTRFGPI
jgi:hypothetical protein